nr:immunoglobulin heavy chain junction region [Macaca mulatta]MOV53884.1 immunoglobulin heavy chain junction region [Macaca mulatta]MOV54658.1 immunoglobulin heavy chain junction region [Macaca mulatta]MOV54889.1 immunoglobulin heavy chain junction region [Macaca mulatta]MOV56379.1 immunoglobulin heavy chain junction region [Macaca mulatta]
CASFLYW